MSVEYIIAFYMLVCVMMTAFNFVFLFYEKAHSKRFEKKMAKMAVSLSEEIERNADFPTEEHRRILERKMRRLSGMEAFDLSMEKLRVLDVEKSEHYLRGISSVFEHLTYEFTGRDDLKCAYFAYIVGRWYRKRPAADAIIEALFHYVRERSFYARQNALESLAVVADERTMIEAACAIDQSDSFHHPKLLTEALLSFQGNRGGLAQEAVKRFDEFAPHSQVAIVNFLRMYSVGQEGALSESELEERRAWVFSKLSDESVYSEVRLACIRYFMRWPWEPAGDELCALAAKDTPEEWEYAAVAATALASYPGEKTVAVLKRCLRSRMWYVRFNAAKSLYDLGLSLETDLADVLSGNDAYARDMLRYRWDYEAMRRGEARGAGATEALEVQIADVAETEQSEASWEHARTTGLSFQDQSLSAQSTRDLEFLALALQRKRQSLASHMSSSDAWQEAAAAWSRVSTSWEEARESWHHVAEVDLEKQRASNETKEPFAKTRATAPKDQSDCEAKGGEQQ